MLTWTEKEKGLDGEMHSIHLFSDADIRQVEALTQKSPFRRFIQPTHTDVLDSSGDCSITHSRFFSWAASAVVV